MDIEIHQRTSGHVTAEAVLCHGECGDIHWTPAGIIGQIQICRAHASSGIDNAVITILVSRELCPFYIFCPLCLPPLYHIGRYLP